MEEQLKLLMQLKQMLTARNERQAILLEQQAARIQDLTSRIGDSFSESMR